MARERDRGREERQDGLEDRVVKIRRCAAVVKGATTPPRVIGRSGGSRVIMVPAGPGTGVKAGPGVRDVLEVCGIRNILTKSHGSTNSMNLVKATIQGLLTLRTREEVARLRGVTL